MNRKKLLSLYGLKWNPFTPDVPTEALWVAPRLESFCARVEGMIQEGGFALVTGEAGNGKSVTLRVLADRLSALPDVTVAVLTRPQSALGDFYRELGELFGVDLRPHNRWAGFKALRERWRSHAESSLLRPVLLVDEAQEMEAHVLLELRLLASAPFDSETYLTVVLAGDGRLLERFREPDLIPLATRIRTRLVLEYASREELQEVLRHALKKAGNPSLLTPALQETLVEHAAGNYRVLLTLAGDLLLAACQRDLPQIDEKLYLELFQPRAPRRSPGPAPRP
ncbi:MAG: ExeA family protein, partial [Planctomycetota bacterium]